MLNGTRFALLGTRNTVASPAMKIALIGVALIPVIFAGAYLSAFLDPYARLNQVDVAVVNEDKGAEISGETRNVGDEVCDTLKDNTDGFRWNFVSAEEAEKGLEDGTYYMTCVIPSNFSEKIASADTDDPTQATVLIDYNQSKNMLASQLGASAWEKMRVQVNESVIKEYWDTVLTRTADGADDLQEAVDGSAELTSGLGDAVEGNDKITTNLGTLADGSATLTEGLGTLTAGATTASDGSSTLTDGLKAIDDGSNKLTAGLSQLNSKVSAFEALPSSTRKLSDGASQVADGLSQLSAATSSSSSTAALDAGVAQIQEALTGTSTTNPSIKTGADSIQTGAGQIKSGASDIATGAGSIKTGATAIDLGAEKIKTGAEGISGGAAQLNAKINEVENSSLSDAEKDAALLAMIPTIQEYLTQFESGASAMADGAGTISGVAQQISTGAGNIETGATAIETGAGSIETGAGKISAGATAISTQVPQLSTGVKTSLATISSNVSKLAAGAQQVSDGSAQLASATSESTINQLTSGVSSLYAGSKTLSEGTGSALTGSKKLTNGLDSLVAGSASAEEGSATITEGAQALKEGSETLGEGLVSAKDGSGELTDGLKEAVDTMAMSQSEITAKADMMSDPVKLDETYYTTVENYGTGFAPFFIGLGLWVGCIFAGFLFKPLNERLCLSRANPLMTAFSGYIPMALFAIVQAVIALAFVQFFLGVQINNVPAYYAFGILVSLSFMAIMQFLVAGFGFPGRFAAVVLLTLQLTSAAGTFPVETAPAFFQIISPYMPMTYVVEGMREIMTGVSAWAALGDAGVIFGFGVAFFVLTAVVALRKRVVTIQTLHPLLDL
jgi:putative membrane protein